MATGIARTASQRMDSHGDKRKTGRINEDVLVAKVRFLSRKVIPMLYIL